MKTYNKLKMMTVVLGITLFSSVNAQNSMDVIKNKYQSILEGNKVGIAAIVKKGNDVSTLHIGGTPLDENSVFNIGSATKKMTAILLLQEEEKGNLSLSDSIGMYLSPIQNVDGGLTIETLLRHRSGLGELVGSNVENVFSSTDDSIYATNFLETIPPNNPELIGKHDYCNTNYILLGHILEKVTDRSYFDLLRERIFEPAGMNNSYPYVSKGLANLAHPINNDEDVYDLLDYRFFANYAYAAGSVASTLSDQVKFYNHLFTPNALLSQTSIDKLIAFDDADYGLGMITFEIDGTTYYGHGGNNIGYSYREYYNPETKDLALFFANDRRILAQSSIKQDLINYISGKEVNSGQNANMAQDFKDFVGKYMLEEANLEMEIIVEGKNMYLVAQGMKSQLMTKSEDTLYDVNVGVTLQRISGNEEELLFNQNGFKANLKPIASAAN